MTPDPYKVSLRTLKGLHKPPLCFPSDNLCVPLWFLEHFVVKKNYHSYRRPPPPNLHHSATFAASIANKKPPAKRSGDFIGVRAGAVGFRSRCRPLADAPFSVTVEGLPLRAYTVSAVYHSSRRVATRPKSVPICDICVPYCDFLFFVILSRLDCSGKRYVQDLLY